MEQGNTKQEFIHSKGFDIMSAEKIVDYNKIKVGTKYDIQEVSVLNLELLFVFGINNIDNLVSVDRDNMKLNFKADLIPTFINVAIGGMRGVLYEKVKSTKLEAYPLPLIDLQELIKQNTFHVEE